MAQPPPNEGWVACEWMRWSLGIRSDDALPAGINVFRPRAVGVLLRSCSPAKPHVLDRLIAVFERDCFAPVPALGDMMLTPATTILLRRAMPVRIARK
jgi:hypothetical protein